MTHKCTRLTRLSKTPDGNVCSLFLAELLHVEDKNQKWKKALNQSSNNNNNYYYYYIHQKQLIFHRGKTASSDIDFKQKLQRGSKATMDAIRFPKFVIPKSNGDIRKLCDFLELFDTAISSKALSDVVIFLLSRVCGRKIERCYRRSGTLFGRNLKWLYGSCRSEL